MKSTQVSIVNNLSELGKIVEWLDEIADAWSLPPEIVFNLNLVIEELITNTISYGYDEAETDQEILIRMQLEDNGIILVMEDSAKAFNPLENESGTEIDKSIDDREIGGLGIHLVMNIMDDIYYERKNGKNLLTLKKILST